ncbi:LPS translocon maturation chaperone LptM [Marinobacter zhejiangensis]|uniref:Lipoprotein-attachment site-containing protein n=1 Tax=Marinobacter zhejiangensis TaxID=488535 RepID=A0A1I4MEI5_9GAMM|nr:lipoprotein [Marinobacter zhejiangensis]SFM01415.1 lipoprotein-attachment site-containing protein [Marinobacter zhejiangensis]
MAHRRVCVTLLMVVQVLLAGCGQKGPLYRDAGLAVPVSEVSPATAVEDDDNDNAGAGVPPSGH